MPIASYIAYPVADGYPELVAALRRIPACDLHLPEEGEEMLVLVTDTPDEAAEKRLRRRLEEIPALACLALVFAHRAEETDEGVAR